jgi:hypothetical protein
MYCMYCMYCMHVHVLRITYAHIHTHTNNTCNTDIWILGCTYAHIHTHAYNTCTYWHMHFGVYICTVCMCAYYVLQYMQYNMIFSIHTHMHRQDHWWSSCRIGSPRTAHGISFGCPAKP